VLIGLGVGGFALYKQMTARPDPRDTVVKWVAALKSSDENGMKALMQKGKNSEESEAFEKTIKQRYPQVEQMEKDIVKKLNIDVGKSTVDGDTAVVPVTVTMTDPPGQPQSVHASLNWVDTTWKLSDQNTVEMSKAVRAIAMPILIRTDVGQQIMKDVLSGAIQMPGGMGAGTDK
jgi:hypothetical protein